MDEAAVRRMARLFDEEFLASVGDAAPPTTSTLDDIRRAMGQLLEKTLVVSPGEEAPARSAVEALRAESAAAGTYLGIVEVRSSPFVPPGMALVLDARPDGPLDARMVVRFDPTVSGAEA